MLSIFEVVAGLLTLTALFAWANHLYLRLPNNVGLLIMGLVASLVLVAFEVLIPNVAIYADLHDFIEKIDFSTALLDGMLAFLLFAGALQIDLSVLRDRAWAVGAMATFGVIISTIVIAVLFWGAGQILSSPISFAWALVFGALISPTDPIAVLAMLKQARVAKTLEMDMAGESLFNDGVGVVLFTILLAAAMGSSGESGIDFVELGRLFFVEALGGAALGFVTGYIAYLAMRAIDDYPVEVLISLALVTGTYALAQPLHVSGPIAVVVTGVITGNRGATYAMSEDDTALSVRLLEPHRRDPELGPVPADRSRGLGRAVRRLGPASGDGRSAHRLRGETGRRGAAGHGPQRRAALRERHDPDPHLGRRARRHFRGSGAVDPAGGRAAADPRRNLRGRAFHPHRAGSDVAGRGATFRLPKASQRRGRLDARRGCSCAVRFG